MSLSLRSSALFVVGGASLLLTLPLPLESVRSLQLSVPLPLESDGGHLSLEVPLSLENLSSQLFSVPLPMESGRSLQLAVPLPLESDGGHLSLEVPLSLETLSGQLLTLPLFVEAARSLQLSVPLPLESTGFFQLALPLPLESDGGHLVLEVPLSLETLLSASLAVPLPTETDGSLLLTLPLPLESIGSLVRVYQLEIEFAGLDTFSFVDDWNVVVPLDEPFVDDWDVRAEEIVGATFQDDWDVHEQLASLIDDWRVIPSILIDLFAANTGTGTAPGQAPPSPVAGIAADVLIPGIEVTSVSAGVLGKVLRFTLDDSREFFSNRFEIDLAGATAYNSLAVDDLITVRAGFRDAAGTLHGFTALDGAWVSDVQLIKDPNGLMTRVNGYDRGQWLVEETFTQGGELFPIVFKRSGVGGAQVTPVGLEGSGFPFTTPENIGAGAYRFSDIARVVCSRKGLGLAWGIRDLELRADVTVQGRVADILQSLTEVFNHVQAMPIDQSTEGATVRITQRSPSPTPDYVFSAHDARIRNITLRKEQPVRVRRLLIQGAPQLTLGPDGGTIVEGTATETDETDSFGSGGQVIARVIETRTFRTPGLHLLRVEKLTFASSGKTLALTNKENTIKEWELSRYGPDGIQLNQPLPESELVATEGIHPDDPDKAWRKLSEQSISYAYDGNGFLKEETSLTKEIVLTTIPAIPSTPGVPGSGSKAIVIKAVLKDKTLEITRYRPKGPLLTEIVVETYAKVPQPVTDTRVDAEVWSLTNRSSKLQGGIRPGGPGRAVSSASTNAKRLAVIYTIDGAAKADVSISNDHLMRPDADFIAGQFGAVNGKREQMLTFTATAMPWLSTGVSLQLTDLREPDGTPIPVQAALITDVKTTYVVQGNTIDYSADVIASYWS